MSRRLAVLDDCAPQTRTLLTAVMAAEDATELQGLLTRALLTCPSTVKELLALVGAWQRARD